MNIMISNQLRTNGGTHGKLLSVKAKKKRSLNYIIQQPLILGDLEGIQTLDLQNRNLTLYSAKLRGHNKKAYL